MPFQDFNDHGPMLVGPIILTACKEKSFTVPGVYEYDAAPFTVFTRSFNVPKLVVVETERPMKNVTPPKPKALTE